MGASVNIVVLSVNNYTRKLTSLVSVQINVRLVKMISSDNRSQDSALEKG